jgi:threonine/homoserine/homoserine lactone efflux protein
MPYPTVLAFLLQAVGISLSGVMAPGPVTAATLAAGARSRHAGAWIAVGHAIVEFPLMGLIMAGAGTVLKTRAFAIGVGLAGGVVLILMALILLRGLRQQPRHTRQVKTASPLWTGVVLTGGNPYFLLWWATVGLALATRAVELGTLAFALFAIVHWLCDLLWLETLSLASNKGVALLGKKSQSLILVFCSAAMALFGIWFILDALKQLNLSA